MRNGKILQYISLFPPSIMTFLGFGRSSIAVPEVQNPIGCLSVESVSAVLALGSLLDLPLVLCTFYLRIRSFYSYYRIELVEIF